MKTIVRDTFNVIDCLHWDDGKPLTTNESIAWWAGWNEGNDDGRADIEDEICDEVKRLRAALERIAKSPDDDPDHLRWLAKDAIKDEK